MSENRLSNLIKDLSKAKQQALLIEVLQSDLESLSGQNDDALKTVCNASAKVFDVGIKSGKTNVLMVGEAQGQAPLSISGHCLIAWMKSSMTCINERSLKNSPVLAWARLWAVVLETQ